MTSSLFSLFRELFPRGKPIIGMVALPPLPGYERSPGLDETLAAARADLAVLRGCGLDGLLVENDCDQPHRILAEAETVAVMTRVARELVVASSGLRVGVEVLLNDPKASLAIALASGARFIRTDYFVDRMTREDYGGEMAIDPEGVIRYRESIGAEGVAIFADVQVKYAEPLVERSLAESARLASEHRADAVVVTGARTGLPPSLSEVREAKQGAGTCPVLVGSGLAPGNAAALMAVADGAIVGTSLRNRQRVDREKTLALLAAARRASSS